VVEPEVSPPPLEVVCPPPLVLVAVVRPPSELVRVWSSLVVVVEVVFPPSELVRFCSSLVVEVTIFEAAVSVLLE
jgi:hypothetical protein